MRMILPILYLAATLTMIGCRERQTENMIVNISLLNSFSNSLDWVELNWKGPDVPCGILPPKISKMTIGAEWPNLSSAKLTFVDEKTRKPYTIDLSFPQVNDLVHAGKCHEVTFRILAYDKADVVCK